jgi:hypothetical protein
MSEWVGGEAGLGSSNSEKLRIRFLLWCSRGVG